MPTASEAADRAARAAGVTVRDLKLLDELNEAAALINQRWNDIVILPSQLRALSHAGAYVAGAFDLTSPGERVQGASVAFLGLRGDRLIVHSHLTAALASDRAVGFALKQHQRAWCLARGIDEVEWTFDPLVRRNAYFNLVKLGAEVTDYYENFYGPMSDRINQGEETDRGLVRWPLASERALAAVANGPEPPKLATLRGEGAIVCLAEGPDGEPRLLDGASPDAPAHLCWVPEDIVALRGADAAAAHAWRVALREAMGRSLKKGYRATAMTRDGWYVLTHYP